MKSLQQIKKELHEYIDGIRDEKELRVMYEKTLKYLKSDSGKNKTSENDPLPNYQQKEIDETINHGNADENKREKELKKSIGRWFSDGGRNPG
jgi:cell division protein FtsX